MRLLNSVALVAATCSIAGAACAQTSSSPPAPPDAKTAKVPPSSSPETPVGKMLARVLKMFAGDDDAIAEDDLADSFKAQVPIAKLRMVTAQIRAAEGALKLEGIEEGASERSLVADAVGEKKGTALKIRLALDDAGKIVGLLIQPGVDKRVPELKSWGDLERQLKPAAERVAFIVREEHRSAGNTDGGPIDRGPRIQWEMMFCINADEPLAIGSAFKLWVLAALADSVESRKAAWDEKLAIRDEIKSLPSGVMQDQPAGKEFTLREFAEKMISISDNTATDHLIHRVGRDKCEAEMAKACERHADLNRPFLTTRDLFVLKLSGSDELPQKYMDAGINSRRAMLPDLANQTPKLVLAAAWKAPRFVDHLEWFASVKEMATTLQRLDLIAQRETESPPPGRDAERPGRDRAPVRTILAINPGVQIDRKLWTYAGFKGGSEPGVLSVNWLLERTDGKRFILSLALNDTTKPIDEPRAIALAQRAIEFLGKFDLKEPREAKRPKEADHEEKNDAEGK